MRYGKLMLGSMVMASLFGLAACSQTEGLPGTAAEQPAAGQPPASSSSGVDSVGAVLASMKATEHVDLATIEEACAKANSQACSDDVVKFKAFLVTKCPDQASCTDKAAMLLYLTRTKAQEQGGIFPATFPQVAAVQAAYDEMTGATAGGQAGGSSGGTAGGGTTGGGAAAGQNPIDGVIADLSNAGGSVTMDKIEEMLRQADPTTGVATAAALKTALAGVQPSSDVRAYAEALLKGEEVSATDAVMALKAVSADVMARLGGGAGGSQPGASGAAAGLRALAPVVATLSGAMAGQQVSWADIADLIKKADPTGAANLADQAQKALEELPNTSPNIATAESLVKGDKVSGADAGATLQEVMAGR